MYLEVYPDIIFILNFFIDFFLLFLLKKVNRKESSIPKLVVAAAVGAVFAVIAGIYPWLNIFLRFLMMNVLASILMILIAFGRLKRTDLLKQVVALYLITYFVGGLMNSIYYYTDFKLILLHFGDTIFSNISLKYVVIVMVILIPTTLVIIRLLSWYHTKEKVTYEVELVLENRRVHTKGLMDTGNCLYDPIFKRPVMVIENTVTKELLSEAFLQDIENAKHYMEGNESSSSGWDLSNEHMVRLRIIPYQSIGNAQGMMMGLMLDKVLINTGKETICNEKVTAAICDNHLSTKDDYHVILHKELL